MIAACKMHSQAPTEDNSTNPARPGSQTFYCIDTKQVAKRPASRAALSKETSVRIDVYPRPSLNGKFAWKRSVHGALACESERTNDDGSFAN